MNFNLGENGLLNLLRLRQFAQQARQSNQDEDGTRIIELSDESEPIGMQLINLNEDSSSSRATSLEQLFRLGEKSSAYIKEGKFEEAYGLVKKQYKLGPRVNFASVLVNYYVSLMQTDRADKATKIRDELVSLLRETVETTPEELEKYGDSLRKKSKYFDAILFYQISCEYCESEVNAGDAVSALQGCALGTKLAVTDLLEKHQTSKQLVKNYIIPRMHKMKQCLKRFKSVDKKILCLVQGLCLHHVEHCEFLVGDLEAREASIKEAISSMRDVLGQNAEKHHLFGGCLNNLGHTYLMKERPDEAAKFFSQAVKAKQNAIDYETETEKKEDIQRSELALQLARRQL